MSSLENPNFENVNPREEVLATPITIRRLSELIFSSTSLYGERAIEHPPDQCTIEPYNDNDEEPIVVLYSYSPDIDGVICKAELSYCRDNDEDNEFRSLDIEYRFIKQGSVFTVEKYLRLVVYEMDEETEEPGNRMSKEWADEICKSLDLHAVSEHEMKYLERLIIIGRPGV